LIKQGSFTIVSSVENAFIALNNPKKYETRIPYIVANNFPQLGLLTALRFIEWVGNNPEGVISLPTGKTPEYFIKWTTHLLDNWSNLKLEKLRNKYGLETDKKPDLRGLHFIQMDEFYPIDPLQHNSFYNYVQKYYIKGFGLDIKKCMLMNCDVIPKIQGKTLEEIFSKNFVNLDLRYRKPRNPAEIDQQNTIQLVDQWCSEYEEKIQTLGGIGFFLGGIGPDGHIAFNVRGSDHNSTTRLIHTNYETQAAAAVDLGGIEIARDKLVITIGLATITANQNATAIIMAAGHSKAGIVRDAIEHIPSNRIPGSALQKLKGSRFYLTEGSAEKIKEVTELRLRKETWESKNTEFGVIQACEDLNKYGTKLTLKDLQAHNISCLIPDLDDKTVPEVLKTVENKIQRGLEVIENETFFHTGPHPDDIMLGFLPHISHLVRSPRNQHCFINLTSGFTAVTNKYIIFILNEVRDFLQKGKIEMVSYPNFFVNGFRLKRDKDVHSYLGALSADELNKQKRSLSHRVVRGLVEIYLIKSNLELIKKVNQILEYLNECYDGEKNTENIQRLKGYIREFEEELVWAHYGVQAKNVHNLRLGFYTGDIFSKSPTRKRDVIPILDLLKKINPTVITLAFDPEGSGPDTHYKTLQLMAEALRLWGQKSDVSHLRIWGYRNVWHRFHPAEADLMIPVSLNSMAVLKDTFLSCYLSQKDASFPSYELDGPFCDLTNKIWVEQHKLIELVLGKDFWYQNIHPRLRAAHGLVFLKEMSTAQFLKEARRLEQSLEGQIS